MAIKAKTKQFVDVLNTKTGINQQDAYLVSHPKASKATARVNASKLLKQPEVILYQQKYIDKAKSKVISLVDSEDERIALQASNSIIDREYGKPLTKTNNVNINLNIEQALSELV